VLRAASCLSAMRHRSTMKPRGGKHFRSWSIRLDPSSIDDSRDADSPDLSGLRILVVEDSWQIGIALKRLLKAWGADVSGPVATSADAQHLASKDAPCAAIVDFSLRGGEHANALIDRLHEQGIYVIVTSGYAVLPAVPRHAAAFLAKPFSETQLIGSLAHVIARNRTASKGDARDGGVPSAELRSSADQQAVENTIRSIQR